MPNPDDLIESTERPQQPGLRERIATAQPQADASAGAVRQRIADVAARQAPPIAVNGEGQAATPGNLRDKITMNAGASQAEARAVAQRIGPPTLTDVIQSGTPPEAAPAQPGLRERLAARANAAPGAADQAMRQRMGGGIAQAAQQAAGGAEVPRLPAPATGSTFAPGATSAPSNSTVFVDSAGGAAAPGAPRTTMPVPANAGTSRAMVPAGPGATPPSAARSVVPAGPGATPPPEAPAAPGKAPYMKPPAPPVRPGVAVVNGEGSATVPNPGLRDKLTVGANQAQADAQAVAERLNAGAKAVPKPDVGTLRQQVGLHPEPPGAFGRYFSKLAENGKTILSAEEWAKVANRAKPLAGKVGKVLGAGAIADGAYNAYEGWRQGDASRMAWGVGDAVAGVASVVPNPLTIPARTYLTGRGIYEAQHALREGFGKDKDAAAKAKADAAAKPAEAAKPADVAKPAAAAAPVEQAKPATAVPAAAAPRQPNYSNMAANARDEALGAIDDEEAADPRAVYYQTIDHNTGTTTYDTRDRGQIVVKPDGTAVNPEDQQRIDAYTARQDKRDAVEKNYQQMLEQLQGGGEPAPANTGVVADAARTSGGRNANVAAFVQQYGEAAKAAGEKLGVDPNLLLTQWGHETGWGKSVIPGTNNLGNIKAGKGQGGVAATDNMTGSRDNYAQYASPHEFADQYVNLVQSRYPGAVGAGSDMGKFATALKAGGYAEDPAYATKLQAAYKTVMNATGPTMMSAAVATPDGTPAQAIDPREYRDPLKGAVQVIDMNSGNVSVTWPGMGNIHNGMSQDDYNSARAALQKNPQLAERMQITQQGPAVDGLPMPSNVLAGGDGAMSKYAHAVTQAQRFAVNPTGAKLAETALQGEYANQGHQIAAGATQYSADKAAAAHVEAAKIAADTGDKRYLELKGPVNPKTYTQEAPMFYDTKTDTYIQRPAPVNGVAQPAGKPIPQAAVDMLKANPHTAAQFDAQFGPGVSKYFLQGK